MELRETIFRQQLLRAETIIKEFTLNYQNKPGRELTDDEKFALYYASGLSTDCGKLERIGEKFEIKFTTKPCAIAWDGRKFLIGFKEF